MARIRASDTRPERELRRYLWALGLRYRTHVKTPVGKADVVIKSRKIAIFIDGCFWHGCPEHYVRPRSTAHFWDAKLAENVARDRRQTIALRDLGWTVIRLWEHDVVENVQAAAAKVVRAVKNGPKARWPRWRVCGVVAISNQSFEIRRLCELTGDATKYEVGPRTTAKTGRVSRTAL
jgi:DNA mismatch endonuclease (patch repair protein)